MDRDELNKVLDSINWTYAKSYSKTFPHYYTTKDKFNNNELFEKIIYYIREYSTLKRFNQKQYLYYEGNEFEYWEMGRPLKAVQVLNKALIKDDAAYRLPIPDQTLKLKLITTLKDRDDYVEFLMNKNRNEKEERELNLLLCTIRRINGGGKNIIDHSRMIFRRENETTT